VGPRGEEGGDEVTAAFLEGRGLVKRFGGLTALAGVSFEVEEGEVVGIIGPNGAGKTTLFNVVTGAVDVDQGELWFGGRPILGLGPDQIYRLGIARTFQTVRVFRGMTVFENVLAGAWFGADSGRTRSEAERHAWWALETVGLRDLAGTVAGDLQIVYQKRVELARALAGKPRVLLLDELMAGLTAREVEEAVALLRRLQGEGMTVVLIEHVLRAVMRACDRVLVLHQGRKIAEGRPEEVVRHPEVIEVYLGSGASAGC